MKFIHALLALCLVTTAYARPAIIVKEPARITLSTTTVDGYQINGPIAVDGDDAIVIGAREETADDYYTITYNAAPTGARLRQWQIVDRSPRAPAARGQWRPGHVQGRCRLRRFQGNTAVVGACR
jgi:hypothetical protein